MRRSRIPRRSLVAAALGLALLGSSTAQARRYTLPELLDKVGRDYAGVVAARESQAASQAQVSQANRLWWPSGQVTFGITGSPDIKCQGASTLAADGTTILPGESSSNKILRESNCVTTGGVTDLNGADVLRVLPFHGVALNLGITLLQPLYTFGKIEAAKAAAHAGVDLAKGQVDSARNEAKLNAVRAYFGLKWARAAKATLDEGRDQLGQWVKKVDEEIDKGKSNYTVSDVIRLKIALDNAELVALDLTRALDFAQAGLRVLTGDPEADVDDGELDDIEVIDQPLDYYEGAARTHRPEARMLDAGRDAVKANRKLKLAEMLPDIGLLGSFGYGLATGVDDPQNAFMNRPNFLGAGLSLAFRTPLDIALKLARYDEARAQERMFKAKRDQALGGIGLEIRKAYLDAAEARGRRKVLLHAEKIARGWYNATNQALQLGLADARDLSESARNYVELRLRHLQALMDQNVTICVLRNTAGLL